MKVYIVMQLADILNKHINASTSKETEQLRLNNAGTKVILSFTSTSTHAEKIFADEVWYDTQAIQRVLEDSEWSIL